MGVARRAHRCGRGRSSRREICPVFSVENSKEAKRTPPEVAFLSVAEIDGRGAEKRVMWMVSTTSSADVVLPPDEGIAYASVIPGATVNSPALELEAGKRYEVFINSDIGEGGSRENRRYRAHFCLTIEATRLQVRQVQWDEKAGRHRWDVCGIQD